MTDPFEQMAATAKAEGVKHAAETLAQLSHAMFDLATAMQIAQELKSGGSVTKLCCRIMAQIEILVTPMMQVKKEERDDS